MSIFSHARQTGCRSAFASVETEGADAAEAYVRHGWALVSIPAGKKGPQTPGWNTRDKVITSTTGAAALTGNIGLAHAYCSPCPTAALDVDDYDAAKSWLSERGIDLDGLLDAPDAVQIVSGRPNRNKLLYRLPDGVEALTTVQISSSVGGMVLEFRCASRGRLTVQDVLPPSIHPETGRPYIWGGTGNWKRLPTMPDGLLDVWKSSLPPTVRTLTAPAPVAGTPPVTLDPQTVQHLRGALFHLRADDRALWIKAGMALKTLGDAGRGLWLQWSLTAETPDTPQECSKRWEGFNPTKIDYLFVFAEAKRQGWVNPAQSFSAVPVTATSDWPEPQLLPEALLPVRSLDPACLPASIRAAVVDIADRLSCPLDYVVTPLLIGAGAVLGNRVGILPKQHDTSWEVYPVLWGGIIGPPGSMKSPAMEQALKPLRHIEEQECLAYAAQASQYALDKKRYDKELVAYKAGKGLTIPVEPTEPRKPRLIVNDSTYQALGVILSDNPHGVVVVGDELSGLLQSLDTAGQEGARGFYLSGWGGTGSYIFDRIGRGTVHLKSYALSIFGGFQPDRIRHYVQAAQGGSAQNDGLLQRFQLLVWPEQEGTFSLVDRQPDLAALNQMTDALLGLRGPSGSAPHAPTLLHFASSAQEVFDAWFTANENMCRSVDLGASRQSHLAKYRSLIPALALLFHRLEQHSGDVCEGCLFSAIHYAAYLNSHSRRIYAAVNGQDHQALQALSRKLTQGVLTSGFTCRSVYTKGWAELGTKERVGPALERLVELGWLRERVVETGGRKTVEYDVNPLIHRGRS
jgi:hypothetical protein